MEVKIKLYDYSETVVGNGTLYETCASLQLLVNSGFTCECCDNIYPEMINYYKVKTAIEMGNHVLGIDYSATHAVLRSQKPNETPFDMRDWLKIQLINILKHERLAEKGN